MSQVRRRGLRRGYTTGTCAAAAAKAAAMALATGQAPRQVTVRLPVGQEATLNVHRVEVGNGRVTCSVVKDAGDDPDVTHGAEICATVSWAEPPGEVHIRGGPGVGTVTRPGVGIPVGEPAITRVPRRMITESALEGLGPLARERGLTVEIWVPEGEKIAEKTTNARLGIVGGISILGTTGIVVPFSTAAWRASVEMAIDVAAANGLEHIVLSTGTQSEEFARRLLSHLPDMAFVEAGIFFGPGLRRAVQRGIRRVTLAGMIGKLSKVAQGKMVTHVAGNQVDTDFLAGLALALGAPPNLVEAVRRAASARHAQELVQAHGLAGYFDLLCQKVCEAAHAYVGGRLAVECLCFDQDGRLLGRAELG
ncbi:MAG: cobalt-precorrin-5B (C(1))-methyltransferase [Chloroflexota bacterium]|jgi:cobalt-precorrin-5B (C1)-methyltransferase|nr:cobalt-precorrin-5B (C(1))-methyltransferase [Chloroflexota bacterium]